MQVANALNNIIRILFNPRIETFRLFDFLVVKSNESRYLAQVIEIYDDKFDASQNVAKLKIFYKISENNEVMPYDSFTPNKECEIIKIKQEEVETFINSEKETFPFATNMKSSNALNLQYDFFRNNPIVLADKLENAGIISLNIAKKLSAKKNSIIIDATGILEHECAKKVTAVKDFKLPLNYWTIDYVFERCLKDASLEFQTASRSILNEIKKFARNQKDEFIPFNTFIRVILEQFKATPYKELKLLILKMKKYQMEEIFARYKKDVENLNKTIAKNRVVILDLSTVDMSWQKIFLDYIVGAIEADVNLIARVNDENFDVDLINKIYCKKPNIDFIPTVSYNYKKLPSLIQYCKNYILLPSLYQRTDFLDANFALSNLISDECIIFGENTDNFLYLAKDYELEEQEKRKNYKKIALSLQESDVDEATIEQNLGERGDFFENQKKSDSEKLLNELNQIEEFEESDEEQEVEIIAEEESDEETIKEEEFEEIQNPNKTNTEEEIKEEQEVEIIEETKETESSIAIENKESVEDDDKTAENSEEIKEIENLETTETSDKEAEKSAEQIEIKEDEGSDLIFTESTEENKNEKNNEAEEKDDLIFEKEAKEIKESSDNEEDILSLKDENIVIEEANDDILKIHDDKNEETIQKEDNSDEEVNFSDEELDFFQMAKESSNQYNKEEEEEENSDELDLSEVANTSLNNSFEDIINTESDENNENNDLTLQIDDNTTISENIPETKENLPIFKEETTEKKNSNEFEVGASIFHSKYGKGTIIKMIKYEERQLLQIDFEESGKKLLDPEVANLTLE